MTKSRNIVSRRQDMLAAMAPILMDGVYFFCTTTDIAVITALLDRSLMVFREDEGTALILAERDATRHGFDLSMPMCRIVLGVFSALDGVGLTAEVATVLADHGIPCNIVAGYHHNNLFVPSSMGSNAVEVLDGAQRRAVEAQE